MILGVFCIVAGLALGAWSAYDLYREREYVSASVHGRLYYATQFLMELIIIGFGVLDVLGVLTLH